MQRSSHNLFNGEERWVTTQITAVKQTNHEQLDLV